MSRPFLSIVTPCFNEEDNVESCAAACARVMSARLPDYDYEHIFADNASTDATLSRLREVAAGDPRVKVIANSRNVGPFRNIFNAMASASGDAVIPMLPADLQDPPEAIPLLVSKWREGSMVVYGIRTNRQERILLRGARGLFYRLMSLTGSTRKPPAHAGEFMLLDRKVVESVLAVDDQHPFVRGLVAQTEVPWDSIEYEWVERRAGRSKNNMWAMMDQGVNAFVTTARAPSRIAMLLGLLISALAILFGIVALIAFAVTRGPVSAGIPTLVVGVFFFGGLNLFFIGLVGEYVLSIHSQVRRGPAMFETERINFDV